MEVIDNINHVIDEIVDTIVSEYKDCTKCGVSKLKNCFNKDKKTKDGLYCRCKDCVKAKDAKRYQENKDEIKADNAKPENKDEKAKYDKARNAKPATKARSNARRKERRQTDEGYRIEVNLRNRLYKAMGGEKKSVSTMKLVGLQSGTAINGCLNLKSPWFKEQGVPSEELATDHIIPCAEYDLENPDEQRACFHFTNLQFLTMSDNSKKSDRVPIGFDFKSTLKKQLDLIARIEKDKLTYQQVLEMQKAGQLYEVKGFVI